MSETYYPITVTSAWAQRAEDDRDGRWEAVVHAPDHLLIYFVLPDEETAKAVAELLVGAAVAQASVAHVRTSATETRR